MLKLTDNPASIKKLIPAERLFDVDTISQYMISNVNWIMTIKPGIRNVSSFVDGRIRAEEIEVISLAVGSIPDKSGYLSLLSQIHGKIMYPCVVLLEYLNKYKIATWKFFDSDRKTSGVALKSPYVSAWIRDPTTSEKTEQCVKRISDLLLNGEGNIKTLYDQICSAILNCAPQYIGSRAHLSRLLYDLTGKKNHPIQNEIDSRKRYEVKKQYAKYQKKKYGSSYKYGYEYEDIWAAFMEDDQIQAIIKKRRYRDMEELVFQIDTKYEEQDARW